ncbi:alpha-L-rhamnosidase-related protein [Marinoscillum furvescens]|uniref:Alpha-L-rhamnosidase-like protein n=1 Tax=Marinoscillum furvescens DSM 4134 TaxID=1122208 RepID=A0A3D9L1Y4_MARFU|nr:alpha-L-rhamnosidase C-terminal domain-containing protein [Marinoscillum furvescens]RED98362.1 alpha-L-rhamnosidase-like protein [Marinoscillum furvescens DSM 4134]
MNFNSQKLFVQCLSLFMLTLTISALAQMPEGYKDTRVREFVTAKKIVWASGEEGITNLENLLKAGNGQADLVGKNLITLDGSKNPAFVLDFGKELHGGIQLVTGMFEGKNPIKIKITLGESVSEAMNSISDSGCTATNDHAIREFELMLPWLGKIEIGNSGFRFAKIEMVDTDRILKLKEISAISIYRDIPYLGSFKSNDERLNEIWQTGAYTVHLNMQDYLWDGIKRDRLVWVGDMHPEVKTIQAVFGPNEVVPKSLDLIQSITDLPGWMNGISSYSMWWLLIQHEWYNQYGDLAYLEKHKAYIFGLLDELSTNIDKKGKETLDGGRFLDWPTSPNKEAVHAGLQSLMVMVFKTGLEFTTILDEPSKKATYEKTLKKLQKHVPDPNGNKSAAALLAISELRDKDKVNNKWLSQDPLSGVSTFYGYYVLQARALAGDYVGAMDVIRDYWGAMIDLGATTFWEDFNMEWAENAGRIDEVPAPGKVDIHADYGDYCYVGLRHSLCHGWASGPTAWLSEHVLGITIHNNGNAVKIAPNLGDLQWVEGSYPTKHGVVKVRHEKQPHGSVKSDIDIPNGLNVLD